MRWFVCLTLFFAIQSRAESPRGDESVYEQESYEFNDYASEDKGSSTSAFSAIQNPRDKAPASESSYVTASTPALASDDEHVSELSRNDVQRRQASFDENPSNGGARQQPTVRLLKTKQK